MIVAKLKDGTVLREGDKVKTFRDEEAVFISADQNGRNRVYCKQGTAHCEWFPSVIDATLEEVDE